MKRRDFFKVVGGSILLMQSPKLVFASPSVTSGSNKKFIWIILRGAMDSLHTVIPEFDSDYSKLRPKLSKQITEPTLKIDKGFAFNPAMQNMHKLYQQKELLPIVAVGSGYQSRSHFDGQDFLEGGTGTQNIKSGWLARAVNQKQVEAVAIDYAKPVSMRGSRNVTTWYPSKLKEADDDVFATLEKLYQGDERLTASLQGGLELKADAGGMKAGKAKKGSLSELTTACANLLLKSKTMDCAMLETVGWDTHNAQHSRLDRQLKELDAGLLALKQAMGKEWKKTVVAIATEFGRTARENGTGGTDHGTGGVMFLAGGGVKGGQVLGQWPGLKPEQLFQNRDLMPTTNTFDWLATALSQHWSLNSEQIKHVFPTGKIYKDRIV
ncbi:DUF1501 domain-containing protein [Parashewanella curva]|uniref:DUF1501 domain-containing protein n=1 Tax=Parashewanella curva TaxID=2338552 RepID=A0A3L8PT74_9GAMM|nr:DUF1501 domain-containing protein [Parashewanella curva]RLV58019.1 DUF1501 domain-containing protein [Parashewanella curva]